MDARARPWGKVGLVVVLGGIASGLVGAGMSLFFDLVVTGASHIPGLWRAALGCLLAGLGWWALRRPGPVPTVGGNQRLGLGRPIADALLQVFAVGAGASVGREGAPRLASAAIVDTLARRLGLAESDIRILVASAAGAGLAAVYNVPVAGVVFVLEVLLGWGSWRGLAAAVPMCALATAVAWPVVRLGSHYGAPVVGPLDVGELVTLLVIAAVGTVLAEGFRRLAKHAQCTRTSGWGIIPALALCGLLLGVAPGGPALTGNGRVLMDAALAGTPPALASPLGVVPWGAAATWLALVLAKPLATCLFMKGGAEGGLLTPAIATGGALGALACVVASGLGTPTDPAACVLVGASVVLAVTQRAPLFGAVMVWELTGWSAPTLVLLLVATGIAWAIVHGATVMSSDPEPPEAS